jgi:hypothetical protein
MTRYLLIALLATIAYWRTGHRDGVMAATLETRELKSLLAFERTSKQVSVPREFSTRGSGLLSRSLERARRSASPAE